MSIFSVTEIMSYMRCRRQWNYTSYNRMSLTPAMSAPHFVVGTCVHGGLEGWLTQPDSNLVDNYMVSAQQQIALAISNYEQVVGARPSPSELVSLMEALALGKAMMKNYQDYYKTPIDYKQYHLVQTEQTLCIPVPNSYGKCQECNGIGRDVEMGVLDGRAYEVSFSECENCNGTGKTQNYLEGTLDGIIADKRDRMLVLEHKTYNTRPRKDSLNMGFQFIAYQWLLTQSNMGPVIGLAYDGMWKRDGTKHKPEELFMREILQRTQAELIEFELELSAIVTEMSNDPYITHTVPWNGCFDCSFTALCTAQSKNNGYQSMLTSRYTKRLKTSAFMEDMD